MTCSVVEELRREHSLSDLTGSSDRLVVKELTLSNTTQFAGLTAVQ